MIGHKNLFFKVSTSITKFALKRFYFWSFLVWKLFFKRNIPTNWSDKLTGSIWKSYYRMSGKVLPILAGLRRLQVLSKCGFLKALLCKFALCKSSANLHSSANLKLPRALKRIQFWIIISHKQWKTMNAPSGLRSIQAEIFPSVARMEKTWVPGGGGLPYGIDGDARRKFTPKGDHLGVAQAFCDP